MTENKWQHFIPQFYFKYFSNNNETILGYNLRSKKHYKSPIVSQAAKDYFYSKNIKVEKSFWPIEAQFNLVLKKIIGNDDFRILTGQEYLEMLRFISFQSSRTEKGKKLSDDFTEKIFEKAIKPLMKSNKELMSKVAEEDIDKLKGVHPGAFLLGIVSSLEANILLTDLIPAVIINTTEQDFIFSDNPVIFYNLIYRLQDHSFEGHQSPGLLVFCPISSKKCLLLFDPVYYFINLDSKNTISIDNEKDIYSINKLQLHNSLHNIYYQSEHMKESIDKLSVEYFSEYSKEVDLSKIKEVPHWDGGNNSLLVSSKKGIPERINLSFVKCAKPLKKILMVRNAKLTNLYEEIMKKYEDKRDS